MTNVKLMTAAMLICAAAAPCLAARGRVYVKQNAVGANDGTSWANAYTDLQSALSFAQFLGGANVEVWVAKGTYKPTAGSSRTVSFAIPADLYVFGGFAGTESNLSQRTDPAANPTILSGAIGGATTADNSFHVVTLIHSGDEATLDGFTITQGNADGDPAQGYDHGGGVVITGDYPRVRNCKFIANHAGGRGGAVWIDDLAFTRFTNVLFDANTVSGGGFGTKDGGAVYTSSDGYFSHCRFVGNQAQSDGGAAYVNDTLCAFTNCVLSGNTAMLDGGAISTSGENTQLGIANCTFSRNAAGDETGGVRLSNNATVTIRNSILWGNTDGNPATTTAQAQVLSPQSNYVLIDYTTREGDGSANPLLIDADGPDNVVGTSDDNCRLTAGSPAIDAASASSLGSDGGDIDADGDRFEAVPLDLDLHARRIEVWSIANTGPAPAPCPDRGAYEFVPPTCIGDFNNDGQRNTADLTLLLGVFGQTFPVSIPQDINGDHTVNTADLTALLGVFGVPCP